MSPLATLSILYGIAALAVISLFLMNIVRRKEAQHAENLKLATVIRLIEQEGGITTLKQEKMLRVSPHEFRATSQLGSGAESTVFPDGTQNISVTMFRKFEGTMCFVTLAALIGDGSPRFSTEIDLLSEGVAFPSASPEDNAAAKDAQSLRLRALSLLKSVDSLLRDNAKA